MQLDVTQSLGLELIGKQALLQIRDNFNVQLGAQQQRWDELDDEMKLPRTHVEEIMVENFYHGHHPSLVEAPVDRYPNCSVMAWQLTPLLSDFDEVDLFQLALYVELMCKSDDDEAEVNSRIERTVDAAHACVLLDRTLGGVVHEIGNTPSVLLTDVFVRPETRQTGHRFLWQGARVEYTVTKATSLY
jgi:hypothetical protein